MTEDDANEIVTEFIERLRAGDVAGADVIADAAVAAGLDATVFDIAKCGILAAMRGDEAAAVETLRQLDRMRAVSRADEIEALAVRFTRRPTRGVA